jgi:hypothetical protein
MVFDQKARHVKQGLLENFKLGGKKQSIFSWSCKGGATEQRKNFGQN